MVSRDYTQELGLKPRTPVIPLPIALAILAVGGAAMWYGVSKLDTSKSGNRSAEAAPMATDAKPAPQAPAGH